jgi:hypothetical protein
MRIARLGSFASGLMVSVLLAACGSSGSEVMGPDSARNGGSPGGGGAPGAGGAASGGAGPAGSGGAPGGSGGSPGPVAGAGGTASGAGGSGPGADGGMPPAAGCGAGVFAMQVVMDVTWPAGTAAAAGSGKIYLWNRTVLEESGNTLTGTLQGCGTVLPETALTAIGRLATGGTKILIEVPDPVWEAPTMPRFAVKGMASAATATGMVNLEWASLVGINLPDPKAAWPDSYTGIAAMAQDADGDGKPGYSAAPRAGGGFVLPPTAVGIGGLAPAAEKVYLVSRHLIAIAGARSSCEEMAGTATVSAFDSHVMGCQVKGGADCNANQTDFVDQNRMKYKVTSATFRAKKLTAAATCANVRQALPAM